MEEGEPTLRDVLGAVGTLSGDLATLSGAVGTLSGDLATLSRRADEGFEAIDRRFDVVEGRLESFNLQMAVQDAHSARITVRMSKLEAQFDVLGTKLDDHMTQVHAEIAAVKLDTAFIERRLDDVYTAVSQHIADPDAHRRPEEN